jgi:hypothetical protein
MKTLGEMVVKSDVERAVKTCVKIAWNLCEKKNVVFSSCFTHQNTPTFFTQFPRNFHAIFTALFTTLFTTISTKVFTTVPTIAVHDKGGPLTDSTSKTFMQVVGADCGCQGSSRN